MEKRHGKLQRLLAMCLSLMMALVLLAPSAFAADGSATITINRGSGIDKDLTNMTVKAYQVLDQVNPNETDVKKKQYQVTSEFADFFAIDEDVKALFDGSGDKIFLTYDGGKIKFEVGEKSGAIVLTDKKLDVTYPEADLVSRLTGGEAGAGSAATFYTWVEKYIEANKDNLTAVEGTVTADDVTFTALSKGYYALIFSNVPDGVSVKQGIMIATPGEIDLKAEEIPLTKQVKNPSHDNAFGSNTTANMGDTLEYEITSQVPTLTDTNNLTVFNLSDTMQKQKLTGTMTLKLKKDNDEKTFTATVPAAGSGYEMFTASISSQTVNIAKLTVQAYTNGAQTFEVDFLDGTNNAWKDYQGYSITLTYQATLTADAYQINGNKVTLNFTNNGDDSTQEANTEVYTYGIDVEKTFSDGSTTTHYDDVTFELRTAKDSGTISLVKTGDGTYRKPAAGETTGLETSLKLNGADGKLTITGLDVGTYWLVETAAPEADGFTKADPIQIVLTQKADDKKSLDAGLSTAKYNGEGNNLVTGVGNEAASQISLAMFKVLNQKGFTLPQTGGAGTWMFTVGGIVLIAAAGALFLASRKKRSSK